MKLLKSAALLACLVVTACSSVDEKKEKDKAQVKAEPKVAVVAPPVKIDSVWLDGYEKRVREALKGTHFQIERRGDLLVVVAPVKGTFNPDRPSMLLPATLAPITRLAKLVEPDKDAAVMIFGHADTSGDAATNRTLSSERAGAFGAIFRLSGLKSDRLLIQSMGSDLPRASNDTQQGRADNRRVELVFTPLTGIDLLFAQYQGPEKIKKDAEAAKLAIANKKEAEAAKPAAAKQGDSAAKPAVVKQEAAAGKSKAKKDAPVAKPAVAKKDAPAAKPAVAKKESAPAKSAAAKKDAPAPKADMQKKEVEAPKLAKAEPVKSAKP